MPGGAGGRPGAPQAGGGRARGGGRRPGGEPLHAVQRRVVRAIEEIAAGHPNGDDVLVVCHGGVISAFLAHCLGLPLSAIWRVTLSNGSLTEVAPPRVLSVNDTAHLDGLAAPAAPAPRPCAG